MIIPKEREYIPIQISVKFKLGYISRLFIMIYEQFKSFVKFMGGVQSFLSWFMVQHGLHVDGSVNVSRVICHCITHGKIVITRRTPTWSTICLWLIISSRMNGDKRIFISSVIKRENIFQNSLVDRCLDKIHKHYFRNLKFIPKSSHTIKSTSVKFMGGEQWQCDFMTGFFLRSCWWGVVSFNRTGSVDDQWSRSDLYECQFFFSVYSHVLWGKGCIVWYCGVSGWDLNWDIFPAPSSWF